VFQIPQKFQKFLPIKDSSGKTAEFSSLNFAVVVIACHAYINLIIILHLMLWVVYDKAG